MKRKENTEEKLNKTTTIKNLATFIVLLFWKDYMRSQHMSSFCLSAPFCANFHPSIVTVRSGNWSDQFSGSSQPSFHHNSPAVKPSILPSQLSSSPHLPGFGNNHILSSAHNVSNQHFKCNHKIQHIFKVNRSILFKSGLRAKENYFSSSLRSE